MKDNDEECVANSKSYGIRVIINDEEDKVIKELFESLKNLYRNNWESMKGSEFFFNYVLLLQY